MKISGTALLHAPPERVWAALRDPAVLVATIPGCERLEETGPDRYRMTVTAGVASIKGTYAGEVALTEGEPPSRFVLEASGSGAPGTVQARVAVSLADTGEGTTTLAYDADVVVGGPVGGVGQRVLAGVARRTAGEFFSAVDDVLTGRVAAAVPGAPAAAATAGAAAAAVPGVPAAVVGAGTGASGPATDRAPTPPTAPAAVPSARAAPAADSQAFLRGAVVGAAAALAGALVGAVIASRRPR